MLISFKIPLACCHFAFIRYPQETVMSCSGVKKRLFLVWKKRIRYPDTFHIFNVDGNFFDGDILPYEPRINPLLP